LFSKSLKNSCGDIEISGFDNGPKFRSYHNNVTDAANAAYQACQQGLDVYVGVNPRVGQAGTKENVHWLAAFHAEVTMEKQVIQRNQNMRLTMTRSQQLRRLKFHLLY
jgi:putative DNA primase/helicase